MQVVSTYIPCRRLHVSLSATKLSSRLHVYGVNAALGLHLLFRLRPIAYSLTYSTLHRPTSTTNMKISIQSFKVHQISVLTKQCTATATYIRLPADSMNKAAFTPDTCTIVAEYKYPGQATCIRIQVDTCRVNDNFVADTGYNRRRRGIQVNTTCIRATCIRCKRGLTDC